MKTHSFKSFTILELIIVMMLTGFLVGLGYLVINIYVLQTHRISRSYNYWDNYISFKRQMNKDFFESDILIRQGEGRLLCINKNEETAYEFNDSCIVRTGSNGGADSFFVKYRELSWKMLDDRDIVKGLDIEVFLGQEIVPVNMLKHYAYGMLLANETAGRR
jgi:hypothetical protein